MKKISKMSFLIQFYITKMYLKNSNKYRKKKLNKKSKNKKKSKYLFILEKLSNCINIYKIKTNNITISLINLIIKKFLNNIILK